MIKYSNFVIFFKKIYLSINSLLEKNLNKLKFNNILNILRSNKVLWTLVVLIILFLSYLLTPNIYDKTEVKKVITGQLIDKFSLNFDFSDNITYNFFPRPHFIIENSSISENQLRISEIKKLYIFVSLNNFFSLKDIVIKNVVLENANFNLNIKNSNFFIKLLNNNYVNNKLIFKNANVFFRNIENEVLFINKIIDMKYYFDPKELKSTIYSKNEIFNIPYSYKSNKDEINKKIFSKINFNFLKLQIENELNYFDNKKKGSIKIIYNKKKSKANYELNDDLFIFNYFDKLIDPNFTYNGKINLNPFFSDLRGNTDKLDLLSLLNSNFFIIQLIKTEILNNKNLNIDIGINAKKIKEYHNFNNFFLNLKIQEGLIHLDKTKLTWESFTDFTILDSLLYVNKNELILDGKLLVDVKNSNEIFKFIQISKKLRPELKTIELNFNYNFDQKIMNLDSIKVNNQISEKVTEVLRTITLKKNKLQNRIYFKNIIKKAIKAYVG